MFWKTDHNHDAEVARIKAIKVKENLKAKAATTRGTPGQLIADTILSTDVDVRAALEDPDVLKRTMRRQKAKHHHKNPATYTNLIIDNNWRTTRGENTKPFLFYDNGCDSRNRMLVFGADTALEHLARADTWMMDGTFHVAPHNFTQLYVIRDPLDPGSISCVYALERFQLRNQNQRTIPTPIPESESFGVNSVESESFGVNLVESESDSESFGVESESESESFGLEL